MNTVVEIRSLPGILNESNLPVLYVPVQALSMDYPDNSYYFNTDAHSARRRGLRRLGVSRSFALGLAAIAILLGFSFGIMVSDSLETSRTPLFDEGMVTRLFENASPAVVEITVIRENNNLPFSALGTGSGFLVDGTGHILTNNHVIEGADEIRVNLSDGRTLVATRLGISPADDLALLQVDPAELAGIKPLKLANSDDVDPGQLAVAIGSPFRNFNSVTVGIVSGTGRGPISPLQRPIPDMIQTDAALNPGNSGGPLLNSQGEVIGVTSAVRTPALQGIGDFRIGFAVPSNTISHLLPDLLVAQEIRRPWLGISGGPISEQLSEMLGIESGVVVTQVLAGSPAKQAGLQPFRSLTNQGDVIISIDDTPIGSVDDMVSYFNRKRPGDDVKLLLNRDGQELNIDVKLAAWPDT